jgi:hypothetical protein
MREFRARITAGVPQTIDFIERNALASAMLKSFYKMR